MNTKINNSIVREVIIKASSERVYKAITDPKQIVAWFPDAVLGSLEVGERPFFDFGEHGKNQVYIEAAKPNEYFAYRWVPGSVHFKGDVLAVPHTLVEFFITEDATGTKVVLKESGFASLPAETMEDQFKQNNKGWDYMMNRLVKLFSE